MLGDYACVADNGIGAPVNNSVRVNIRYKPEVLDGTAVFLSKVGGDAKLECSFNAYPTDGHQFTWHRVVAGSHAEHEADASAKEEVTNDERHEIVTDAEENTLTSTLHIRNVQETDFQKYIWTTYYDRVGHNIEQETLVLNLITMAPQL
ncbi:hypothetical protein RvY_15249 [Ramazzottius varieornatus]|uniref:Ig-like domain-containing protein n=1 Tax=Ramazzottius varieornatus TaxID=947166 RepID=A0A1D1VXN9_RAMVA|nr:hypothetical protein RvY_15249 [Ramazzottius varieornatus]